MSRLDEVWKWYEAARDSLRIVRSLLETQPDVIQSTAVGTVFETEPRLEVLQRLHQAEQELDDLTIIALWASIESLYKKIPKAVREEYQLEAIRKYRNWVAHGRTKKRPSPVTPDVAYERLRDSLRYLSH